MNIDAFTRQSFAALNSAARPLIQAGLGSPLRVGLGLVVVETIGRKSGLVRKVPVVAARFGSTVVVSSVRGSSQWISNFESAPAGGLWLFGKRRDVTATVTRGPLSTVVLRPSS